MTLIRTRSALTALALTLLAAPALAQAPSPDAPPPGGPGRHGPDKAHMQEMMQKHREEKSQDLHTILNIRPNQEAAFAAFQGSMTPPPRPEHREHPPEALTTPQRLDKMAAMMDQHVARMHKRVEATKAFYAALSPEQQKVFDALERLHGGHRGMRGGPGGERGGPPMHMAEGGPGPGPDGEDGPPPPPGQ